MAETALVPSPRSPLPARPGEPKVSPPTDSELWSYVERDDRWFLVVSALSRISLGAALVFLSFRGTWLVLLLPFALAVVVGGVVNLVWATRLRPFDRDGHQRLVRRGSRRPKSVDVYICTCGERPEIVENTIRHAVGLEHDAPVTVYVLDDSGSSQVAAAAERHGATYLHRDRAGWMKKAGNLSHGYERSSGELILVLDADFAARPDFLAHTVGYFDSPDLGILQTPQFFRVSGDNWVERGSAAQQEQFYRIGMRARDRDQGAICVGTNAVYSRRALDKRGGMALLEHSEDIFTGLKVVDAGYRVQYLPLPLAAGTAPSTTKALASQQYRWARGNFALAGTPLFKRIRLTGMQRLAIWDGWIFYVASAFSPFVAIVAPVATLLEAPQAISLAPAGMVVPALLTEFVLQPRWLHQPAGAASRRVGLISQVAHFYALRDHLTDRDQEWIPTGGDQGRARKVGTDRITDQIATVAIWGVAAIFVLVIARSLEGWHWLDLAPVAVFAAIALPSALGTTEPAERSTASPAVRPSRLRRLASARRASTGRDGFLDVVRAVSILRVIMWHALGYWWISWTFAAMPAVFYVSGAVLARRMQERGAWPVVRTRLAALLPPYLAFVAVALTLVTLAQPAVWQHSRAQILSWVVPYRPPAVLAWEEGWLSSPLWFLRALVLVLLLTPLVRPVLRRVPWAVSVALWAGAMVVFDVWVARQDSAESAAIVRGLGDVVCFGGFFAIGAAGHHRRVLVLLPFRWLAAFGFAAAAIGWAWWHPPVDLVVNNSFVLFTLVGLAWLAAVLALEDRLRHLATVGPIAVVIGWATRWAMSIYLWHTLVLVLTYYLVGAPQSLGEGVMFAAVFALLLPLLLSVVRVFEGLARRGARPPRPHPAAVVALVATLVLLAGQASLFPTLSGGYTPPVPSGRPPVGGTGDAALASPQEVARQARDARSWINGNDVEAMAYSEIGSATQEQVVTRGLGDGDVLDPEAPFEALSLTKTMVAAVALQLVEEGRLTLDEALPDVPGVPQEVTEALTLRRLLAHATGLIDYRVAPGYALDSQLTAPEAITLSFAGSDLTSTKVEYAATNFLLAGLVLEQVTGERLDQLLDARIIGPLGLTSTQLIDNSREGFVGFASGGLVSTLPDLARWFDALLRQRVVLSGPMLRVMLYGGRQFQEASGLGMWRLCPCTVPTRADPEPFVLAFHDGGDARVVYIPSRDLVLAMRFSEPLYDERQLGQRLQDVTFAIADRRDKSPRG